MTSLKLHLEDRAYALTQLNKMVNFHKKHLCFGRGAPSLGATAPIKPFAPNQIDVSRKFRPSDAASKMTYNLVVLDGKKDYLADRQAIRPELRSAGRLMRLGRVRLWSPRRIG